MTGQIRAAPQAGSAAPTLRGWGIATLTLLLIVLAAALTMRTDTGNTHAQEQGNTRINENSQGGAPVGTPIQATTSGAPPTYSLSGPGASSFTINPQTGEVSLAQDASLDFETRTQYQVTVTASSQVIIEVANVNEPGTVSLSTDEPGAGETITATLEDPDGGISNTRWSWARLEGNGPVAIDGASSSSYTTVTADIGHRISATARYDDDAGAGRQATGATARQVRNDPPAFAASALTLQVPENAHTGTAVGDPITAQDPNGHRVSYSITGSDSFQVDAGTGQLQVTEAAVLDHETRNSHQLTLTATDSHGGQASVLVTVSVTNAEEPGALTLQHGTLRRGTALTTVLEDPDGSVSHESWQWSRSGDPIDGARDSSYTATSDDVGHTLGVTVSYQDGHGPGKSASAATASAVGNDPPIFPSGSLTRNIDENAPAGAAAGDPVTAQDPNGDTLSYQTNSRDFPIDPQTGVITASAGMDHEQRGEYTITVTATDDHGAAAQAEVVIAVNNLDEPGTLSLSNAAPRAGDIITASLTDPDGEATAETWQWRRDGNDIPGATSGSYTAGSEDLGHTLSVSVSYEDPQGPGKSAEASADLPVSNDPPAFTDGPVSMSVAEDAATGTNVGEPLAATDPNNDTLAFALTGDGAGDFTVDKGGQITVAAALDHEGRSSYSLTATVSDPAGGSDSIHIGITVENAEELGAVSFDAAGQPEVNTPVTASLSDPDGQVAGESWQWQSSDSETGPWTGIAGADSAGYTPQRGDIGRYLRATVSYTDGHTGNVDAASAVNTLPVRPEPNRPPAFPGSLTTTFNISINVREGVRVAPPFTAEDPNGDTLVYSIVPGTPDAFTINPATGEVLMGSLELAEGATYTASISVTDGVNTQWQEDPTADDSLDLTMTIVNPNIVIEPSSRAAFPRGLWVDDEIVVTINESTRDRAMFYDRETQQYLEDRSFRVGGNSYPTIQGAWSNGNTLYVIAAQRSRANPGGKIFAYRLSDGARRSSEDIILPSENAHPIGLTGRDGVMYVGDGRDRKVYAYNIASGERQSSSEIDGIDTLGRDMTALWTDGETMWISYWLSEFVRAYDVTTGERKPGLDVQLARENAGPIGIDSDGFNLWCMDSVNDTIYGYVLPR